MAGRQPTIGVILAHVGEQYYIALLEGVRSVAADRGARVVAFSTVGSDYFTPSFAAERARMLARERVDGWLCSFGDTTGQAYIDELARSGAPVVMMSARSAAPTACSVLPANAEGVRQAVRHLIEHGHRRIAFAGAFLQTTRNQVQEQVDIRERYEGYLAALAEAGIPADPALTFRIQTNFEHEGQVFARQLISSGLPATAVVLGTDRNAIGFNDELQRAGFRVPDDVAVVGFDDVPHAQHQTPPLATVSLPFDAVSTRAAELLLAHLLDGEPLPEVVRIHTQFVPRRSCGCARRPRSGLLDLGGATSRTHPDALADAVLAAIVRGRALATPAERKLRVAASKVSAHLLQAFSGLGGGSLDPIRESWLTLLEVGQDTESAENLVWLIDDLAASQLRTADAAAAVRIRAVCQNLRMDVLRGTRALDVSRQVRVQNSIEAARMTNAELVSTGARPTDLSWLHWLEAGVGIHCEWTRAPDGGITGLRVVAAYADPVHVAPAVGTTYRVDEFPPAAICDSLLAAGHVLCVSPMTTQSGETRGVLAFTAPIHVDCSPHASNLSHWAELYSAAVEREQLVSSLRESEARYALAARAANDGLWDLDLRTARAYFSPRWKAMLGYLDDEVGTTVDDWLALVHPDDRAGLRQMLDVHSAGTATHLQHEYRMVHRDGRDRWMLARGIVVFGADQRPVRIAGSQTDITERREAEERLRRSALHDALTGLPNRALLNDRLEQAIARFTAPPHSAFAVLFLDLDDFKAINDSLGHVAGDALLVQIAARVTSAVKPTDTVGRLGGDEFAVLLTDIESEQDAVAVAEKLQLALREPFDIGDHRVVASASVGITMASKTCGKAEDYLRDADIAMYTAKAQGRARHQLFDTPMRERAIERLSVEAGLRRALENGELLLHYQPIVSLADGTVVGAEALMRWQHPERGLMPPLSFLPVAEQTGLILGMSEWALRTAAAQAKAWSSRLGRALRINVNVHPLQLRDREFARSVEAVLTEVGLSPAALGIELVEGTLIDNRSATIRNLEQLRAAGVHISIDDFGTGYSSLSYLKRLPLDTLKIDRSFIMGVPQDANDVSISTTIVGMARSLKLTVVAEGVETEAQAKWLRELGCDRAQGYLFSRPLPAAACEAFILRERRISIAPPRPPRLSERPSAPAAAGANGANGAVSGATLAV